MTFSYSYLDIWHIIRMAYNMKYHDIKKNDLDLVIVIWIYGDKEDKSKKAMLTKGLVKAERLLGTLTQKL